jgi:hypothetical protein
VNATEITQALLMALEPLGGVSSISVLGVGLDGMTNYRYVVPLPSTTMTRMELSSQSRRAELK